MDTRRIKALEALPVDLREEVFTWSDERMRLNDLELEQDNEYAEEIKSTWDLESEDEIFEAQLAIHRKRLLSRPLPSAPRQPRQAVLSSDIGVEMLKYLRSFVPDLVPLNPHYRIYGHGDWLRKHRDQLPSMVTISIMLGLENLYNWALHVEVENVEAAFDMRVGDAVVMRSGKFIHWRKKLPSNARAACMFFYFASQSDLRERGSL